MVRFIGYRVGRAWCPDYAVAKTKEIVMAAKGAEVTIGQAMSLREDAIAKGVTRDQWQKGGRTLSAALDALKQGARGVRILPAIQPPSWGGRIHFVDSVPVQLDREWETAVNEAGPDTPDDYIVCRVGHLYQPTGTGILRANFVLVSLAGAYSYQLVLDWARQYDLLHASPRHVFALAKHKPDLHRDLLKANIAFVVSPVECVFKGEAKVCFVTFDGGSRVANTSEPKDACTECDWIAFLCE